LDGPGTLKIRIIKDADGRHKAGHDAVDPI
jgi:hypothetical protein